MIFKRAVFLALTFLVGVSPVQAQSVSVGDASRMAHRLQFRQQAAIQAWYRKRFGDPDAAFALHTAEDTCGFDYDAVRASFLVLAEAQVEAKELILKDFQISANLLGRQFWRPLHVSGLRA